MNNFLERLKLIDYLTTELTIIKIQFVERLGAVTDEGGTGAFSEPLEVFTNSKNEFKGSVTYEGFKIKKRRKLFDVNLNTAVATGSFEESKGSLKIETKINGFSTVFIPIYLLLIVLYTALFISLIKSGNTDQYIILFFTILHLIVMLSLPYFMMRRSVKRLKYELEREFYYLTKVKL